MPNRFVNLQSELRTIKNDVERAGRSLIRMMQRDRLFGDAPRVLDQLQFFDQFIAFILPLPAIRIWIRTLLNLVSRERVCGITRARGIFGLMNVGSLRRYEPLFLTIEVEVGFGQGYAGNGSQ